MGACISSQSNDNSTKKSSQAEVRSSSHGNDNSATKLSLSVAENEVEFIATIVVKISRDVSSMGKMIKQLGTSEDTEKLRSQLDRIDHNIDQLIVDAGDHIREVRLNGAQNLGLQPELLKKFKHLIKSLKRYDDEKEVLKKIREELKMALRLNDLMAIEAINNENLQVLKDTNTK